MGSLKEQLAKFFPSLVTVPAPPPVGAKCPPYSKLDIPASYERFCTEIAGRDFADPRGRLISLLEENFPKLLGAKMKATGKKAKASIVLASLRNGTFDASLYTTERDRITTLFWIEDTLCDCDSIHENNHSVIEADEVYVKRYDKLGAKVKLVFTRNQQAGQVVVITSFLTDPGDLPRFVKMPAVWAKK